MISRVCLCAALTLLTLPAWAFESRCVGPYAPTVPNGGRATLQQMNTVRDEVKAFIARSDQYQECLLIELKTLKEQAARDKKADQNAIDGISGRISANQREKERVGNEYNAAAQAYNVAHGGATGPN